MSREDRASFTELVHLKVRYLSGEDAAIIRLAAENSAATCRISSFEDHYLSRRGKPVHLPFDGVVTFDRSGFVMRGTQEEDEAQWEWTRRVEEFVTRDNSFTK